ncbi:choice-of-anchor L domain-containing protein [Glaciecola siphonariae]|uniref:Choice-of-anchor L domain-containing protein n=1 Tax=Glaciecola siphonariae TaxID=521012 RepID=A0ABV9LRT2_9ALTE
MLIANKFSRLTFLSAAISTALVVSTANAIEIVTSEDPAVLANSLIIPDSGVTVTSSALSFGVVGEGGGPIIPEFEGLDGVLTSLDDGPLETGPFEDGPTPNETIESQAGVFTNNTGTYGLPSQGGLVFSTGDVNDYGDGENTANGNSTSFGNIATGGQNDILSSITGQSEHFDPVVLDLTFDVSEDVSVISFIAAFGSEEFPNFVNSGFIDGFGMFLNGVNVAGALPTGGVAGDPLLPININHPDFAAIEGTELNGVIAPNGVPLVRFDVPVEPGSTGNTFQLILADAGDSAYDSTIYLSSFGNFDSESGNSEFTPILPDPSNPTNEDGAFVFVLPEVDAGQTIWIDPDIATGYTYAVEDGGLFASVTAPSPLSVNDTNGYTLSFMENGVMQMVDLAAGGTYLFGTPVDMFTISGIDVDLMLNPNDPTVFVTGVSFAEAGTYTVTQLPITTFVPDSTEVSAPGTLALISLSLFGLMVFRKKRA